MAASQPRYWLAELLDAEQVRDRTEIERFIADPQAMQRVRQLAEEAATSSTRHKPFDDHIPTVVLGHTSDLSAVLSCRAEGCLIEEIDSKWVRPWQLFDRLVAQGLGPRTFARTGDRDEQKLLLRTHLDLLLHIRGIGAEDDVLFREKPYRFCAKHYAQHAEELGLPLSQDDALARSVIQYLCDDGSLVVTDLSKKHLLYTYQHPLLDVAAVLRRKKRSKSELDIRYFARGTYARACLSLMGDVALSQDLGLPLISDARTVYTMHNMTLEESANENLLQESSLAVRVPVLEGLSSEQLLALKREHRPNYEKFRGTLLEALRVRVQEDGDRDPTQIARSVEDEFIKPALADIEVGLKSSLRATSKKIVGQAIIGAVTMAIGVKQGIPLVVGAGVTATVTSGLSLNKFQDRKGTLEESDMYFLWLAQKAHRKH